MSLLEEVLVCPCEAKAALGWKDDNLICMKEDCRYSFSSVSRDLTVRVPVLVNSVKL